MDSEDNHIHGRIEDVIRQLIEQVGEGEMTPDQMVEVVASLAAVQIGNASHDVTIGFRTALIAQGYDAQASKLKKIVMVLTSAGAAFQYGLAEDDPADWMDAMPPEVNRAFLQASVWVLRAGNIGATIAEDGNHIDITGPIVGDALPEDAEEMVKEFVAEIDRTFPTVAPKRIGTWW